MHLLQLATHEALGHAALNLDHDAMWMCGTGAVGSDIEHPTYGCGVMVYGTTYSPMGSAGQGGFYHFHASDKERLGFLGPDQTVYAEMGVGSVHTLDAFEVRSDGFKQIKIPLPIDGVHHCFLEYRKPLGFDGPRNWRGRPIEEGVYVRVELGRPVNGIEAKTLTPQYGAIIQPGAPFVDPYRGVTIEVLEMSVGQDDNQASVSIFWDL